MMKAEIATLAQAICGGSPKLNISLKARDRC
jgi:hypothetical protein